MSNSTKKNRRKLSKSRLAIASRATVENMESRVLLSGSVQYSYATDQSTYNTTVEAGSVTVNVFLKETLSGGATSIINSNGSNGLACAGFSVVAAAQPALAGSDAFIDPFGMSGDTSFGSITKVTDVGGPGPIIITSASIPNTGASVYISGVVGVAAANNSTGNFSATEFWFAKDLSPTTFGIYQDQALTTPVKSSTTYSHGGTWVSDFNGALTPFVNASGTNGTLLEGTSVAGQGVDTGNVPAMPGSLPNEVFLGTVTIDTGSTPGTTTFNLGELNAAGGNTVTDPTTATGTSYDVDLNGSANGISWTGAGSALTPFTVVVTDTNLPTAIVNVTAPTEQYTGAPYAAATVDVTGSAGDDTANASAEGALTTTYYAGTLNAAQVATATPLAGAPTGLGAYTVVASFGGDTEYNGAVGLANFTITPITLTASATVPGKTFDGTTTAATPAITLTGVLAADAGNVTAAATSAAFGSAAAGSENVNITGITLSGSAASGYTVAPTLITTATIAKATPIVTVTDNGGAGDGVTTFPATATVTGVVAGVDNTPMASLEGTTPALSYYAGTLTLAQAAAATPLSGAPSASGPYTVVANFGGSTDYAMASSLAHFTVFSAPSITSLGTTTGTDAGDTTVTIVGNSFSADATVTFDGLAASGVTFVDPQHLTVVTPADLGKAVSGPAHVNVVVTNSLGSSAPATYTYTATTVAQAEAIPSAGYLITGATNGSPIVVSTASAAAFANGESIDIASIGGNTSANGNHFIQVLSPTTLALYNDAALTVPTSGAITNDVQTINVTATTGSYELVFGGKTTAALAFNSTTTQIQAALVALTSIGANNVTVTGTSSQAIVTFVGTKANTLQAAITSINVGEDVANTIVHTTPGNGAYTYSVTGTATGGSSNTIILASSTSEVGNTIVITSGTGVGSTSVIISQSGTTATVSPAWGTAPASGSGYGIYTGKVFPNVTVDSNPVISAILSQPGTVNTKTYTSWSFLANDGTGSMDVFGALPGGYTPVVGNTIKVSGNWSPFDGIPELASVSAISTTGTATAPAPLLKTIPALTAAAPLTEPSNVAGYEVTLQGATLSKNGGGSTAVSTNFTQPAVGSTVSVTVGSTAFMVAGQYLSIPGGGYYSVASITSGTVVVLTNPTPAFTGNAAPGATISSGSAVTGVFGLANSPSTAMITDSSGNSMIFFYWETSYSMANANLFGTPIPTGPVDMTGFVDYFSPNVEFAPISITSPSVLLPTVTVTSGNTTYNGTAYVPSANVTGTLGPDTGALSYNYYVGTGTGGTNLGSVAPTNAGTYTVVASVAADSTYLAASSSPATFTIAQAVVAVGSATVSGKTYDGTTTAGTPTITLSGEFPADAANLTASGIAAFASPAAGSETVNITGIALGGSAAGNYMLSSTTATTTATIGKASSTTTATGGSFTYDGTTHLGGSAVVAGAGTVTGSAVLTYTGDQVDFGSYTVIATYGGDANHTGSSDMATITIAKASSTTTATGGSFTYDGTTHTGGSAVVSGAGTVTGSAMLTYTGDQVDAGSYTVIATYAGDPNHTGSSDMATITIAQASVTVASATVPGKIYDGSTTAGTPTITVNGVLPADAANVTATGSAAFASAAAGSETVNVTGITLGGSAAGNYVLASTSTTTTATIAKASVSIATATVSGKIYDRTTTAGTPTITLNGVLPVDATNVTATGSAAFASAAAGSQTVNVTGIMLGGSAAGNYMLSSTSTTTTATIAPKLLGVSISEAPKVYDGTAAATPTYTLTGVIGADVVTASGTASFANKNAGTTKTVTATGIHLSGAAAGNYIVPSTTNTTADITPLAITGSITVANKAVDGNNTATILTRTLSGVISGDMVSYVGGTATFATSSTGTGILVTATGLGLSGADAGNYTVNTTATTTASILTPIVYSYVTDQSTYDLGAGQTVTVNIYLQETLNGNTSLIDANGQNGLVGAGFEVVSGTLPGSPSAITAVNPDSSDFNGIAVANVNNSAVSNPNEADVQENVVASATSGVELGNGNGATTSEVFLGSLTITGGATLGTTTFNLGEFAVNGFTGGNTITNPNGVDVDTTGTFNGIPYTGVGSTVTTFSVDTTSLATPTVTVTSGNSVYNGNAYVPSSTVSGPFGADSSATETYTYYAGNTATGTPLSGAPITVGTYTVVASFAGDTSYAAATSVPSTFQITPKALTASATVGGKTYDRTTTAGTPTITLNGVVAADAGNVTATGNAAFASAAAGSQTVNITGITLGGSAAGNYTLSSTTATTTATITPKLLGVSISEGPKVYDGTAAATPTYTLTGVIGADVVTASGTASFANKNVGTTKTVTATGIHLIGAAAGNYTVPSTTNTTADITPLAITGSITVANKAVDGNNTATILTRTLSGVISGDMVSYVGGTATFATSSTGTGILVTATGLSLSGADAGNYTVNTTATTTASILTPIVYSYVTDQTTYDLGAGQTVTVNVYLQETLNGNTSLIDANGQNGLVGAGFEVVSGTLPGSPSAITAVNPDSSDFNGIAVANVNNSAVSNPNEADVVENVVASATSGVELGNGNGATTSEVFLGSLTITGGATLGTTTFNLGEFAVNGFTGGNTITNPNGVDVDTTGTFNGIPYTGVGSTVTTFSVDTTSLATPTVTVTSGNSVYNGNAYTPSSTVSGQFGTDSSATETYTYYSGNTATGTALSGARTTVGTYTVVASFAGDTSYAAATSVPSTFQITPKALTASATVGGKTYDGTTTAGTPTITLNGIVAADAGNVTATGNAAFASPAAGSETVNITGITLGGSAAGNYMLASTTATTTATIAKASSTTTATGASFTYDGTTHTGGSAMVSGAGIVTGSAVLTYSGDQVDAGSYTVIATYAGDTNHTGSIGTAIITIGQASSTVTVTGASFTYDGTTHTGGSAVVNGAGTVTGAAVLTYTGDQVDAGSYTVIATYAGDANHAGSTGSATITIAKASSTTTATGGSFTYDGTTHTGGSAVVAGAGTITGSAVLTYSGDQIDAGSYTVIATYAGDANHTGSSGSATLTIGKAAVTIASATVAGKIYDRTTTAGAPTITLSGVVSADSAKVTATGSAAFASASAGLQTVNITNITLTGSAAGNYSLATNSTTTTATITPKSLSVAITEVAKIYDGTTNATPTYTLTGVITGDAVSASGTALFASANVGTGIAVTSTGIMLAGAQVGDYTLSNATASTTANIAAKSLSVAITELPKTYDGTTTATPTYTLTGVVTGDTVTAGGTATFASKNVGTGIVVTATGITLAGAQAGNYTLSNTTATTTGNIRVAPLGVMITANSKVYDGTTSATVTYTLVGLVTGDTVTATGTAAFASATVGTGIAVTATGITISGASASNYMLSGTTAATTANITVATPTVTATDAGGTFTGSAFPATATVTGISGTPASSLEGVSPTFTYYAGTGTGGTNLGSTAPGAVGTYTVVANFAGSADYAAANSNPVTFNIVSSGSAEGIVVLDPTGSNALLDSGSGSQVNVANGLIVVDSSNSQAVDVASSATLTAKELDITGNYHKDGNATITGTIKTGQTAISDPFASLPVPTTSGLTSRSTSTYYVSNNQTVTLNPGLYVGGISIGNNDNVTLNPGTYYLQGGGFFIGENSTVTGTGVLIYNAAQSSSDQIAFDDNAVLTVSAATTGTYAGVAIFQTRGSNAQLSVQHGGKLNVTGAVYASGATLYVNGTGSAATISTPASASPPALLVVKDINDQSGGVINVNTSAPTPATVTVTSGNEVYTGSGYVPATTVTGASGTDTGATVTYTYYVGTGTGGTNLGATAPKTVGTYTVVAKFAGDTKYTAASSAPTTFQITPATPTVIVTDAGGHFTGSPFPATATVNGSASLEGVTPTLTYYAGTTATGTPLPTAASAIGTYTVVAKFAGSADYAAATSSPVTFSITSAPVIGMVLLDNDDSSELKVTSGGSVTATGQTIVVDSNNSQAVNVASGATLSASELDVTGKVKTGGGTITGTVKTGQAPVSDPLAHLATPSYSGVTVRSWGTYNVHNNTTTTLNPGVYYGGINIGNGCHVTLNPGIYYIIGGGITVGSSTVTGTGVMIYNGTNCSTDSIQINGGNVTLTAMTTGVYAGIAIFQSRGGDAPLQVTGSNSKLTITGSIYAVAATINISAGDTLSVTRSPGSSIADIIASDLNDSGGKVILA